MKLFFVVMRAVLSLLLLVVPTTFGTSEFVPVASYSASGHSACDFSESGPESGPSEYVPLDLIFCAWSFWNWYFHTWSFCTLSKVDKYAIYIVVKCK